MNVHNVGVAQQKYVFGNGELFAVVLTSNADNFIPVGIRPKLSQNAIPPKLSQNANVL
jgi:hypothetical protein